ncbi:MAG: serine/threonine protein kinase, partial [Prevotella sp.]|nr:serine/threonine protein kinase [Prevotella sp.]
MLDINEFLKTNRLFDGHYKLLRALSTEGGTADVWLAIDINTIDVPLDLEEDTIAGKGSDASGMLVAIKIYRPKNALDVEGEQRFRDEFKIVYECHHENLLQPTSFSVFEGTPYLVLPYCKYGSSEQLIGKNPSKEDIWKFILDVSSGLNRLHTNEPPIIHQDIKPANVLIDNSKNYAITDFGISSKSGGMHGYYYDEENSGTMAYMAPERFQDNVEPMSQSDIWAFGATLCEILTGKVPFGEEGGKKQLEGDMPMPAMENVPADIKRLIYACLSKDIGNRPTASQLREAALARQYPIRQKKLLYWAIGIIAAVCVACIMLFLPKSHKEEIASEQLYEIALLNLNSDKADEVKRGALLMDSLSNLNYVPAIYQMAFTYGWYNDPVSLKRKRLLGIEVIENNEKGGVNLPKLDRYSNEAVSLFLKMLELNDTTYSSLNAQAAYRLACYYVNPNPIFKANLSKAKRFLE